MRWPEPSSAELANKASVTVGKSIEKTRKGNYVVYFFSHMLFITTRRFSAAGLPRSRCHTNEGRNRGSATAAGDGSRGIEREYASELNHCVILKRN